VISPYPPVQSPRASTKQLAIVPLSKQVALCECNWTSGISMSCTSCQDNMLHDGQVHVRKASHKQSWMSQTSIPSTKMDRSTLCDCTWTSGISMVCLSCLTAPHNHKQSLQTKKALWSWISETTIRLMVRDSSAVHSAWGRRVLELDQQDDFFIRSWAEANVSTQQLEPWLGFTLAKKRSANKQDEPVGIRPWFGATTSSAI
jgi:hypothetical protein